jgi:hypothetical protein
MDDIYDIQPEETYVVVIFIAYDTIFLEAHALNVKRYAHLFDVALVYIDNYLFSIEQIDTASTTHKNIVLALSIDMQHVYIVTRKARTYLETLCI